jgi:hypothetical protein
MAAFSGWIGQLVSPLFRKDQSGRLVFLPYGPRRAGYYIDSAADDHKIRSLVTLYAVSNGLIQLVGFLSSYIISQTVIFPDHPTSLAGKLQVALIAYFISLVIFFVLPFCLLRRLYTELMSGFCSPLNQVRPESIRTLEKVPSPLRRRLILLTVGMILILAGLLLAAWFVHVRKHGVSCTPKITKTVAQRGGERGTA